MRVRRGPLCCLLVSVLTFGCGGGGGGSSASRPPVAAPPVCSNIDGNPWSRQVAKNGGFPPNILVPDSSIEHSADAGVRMHTNILILRGSYGPKQVSFNGYTPNQIAGAYGVPVPVNGGSGAIAVVDAFHDPTSLSDFNTFSSQFGLPAESSSTATSSSNNTFQVVYATGAQPATDAGWSTEMSLDIEWAHALAPKAKIYLVEAATAAGSDLMAAVGVAKALPGVQEVSISFGTQESACTFVQYDSILEQSNVTFFCAAGDTAGERDFPALSVNSVCVGGTTLTESPLGTWAGEAVWSGTGCGPSQFEPRPVFQDKYYPKIGQYRGGCDIGAVADPNTGVVVYDSTPYQGNSGWFIAGGTSAATPIVAAIVNSTGVIVNGSQSLNTALYAHAGSSNFHAITSGSSAGYAAGTPWCFPVGLGSPNGLAPIL